MLMVACLSR